MNILPLLLAAVTAPATSAVDKVSDFNCPTSHKTAFVNVREVYAAYGSRSVTIVKLGLAGDRDILSLMVAPETKFSVFAGDVGRGPRSKGAVAAIEFAQQVAPRNYQFSAGSAGFVSMDPCGIVAIDVTFRTDEQGGAIVANFRYQNGMLIDVVGSDIKLFDGDLP